MDASQVIRDSLPLRLPPPALVLIDLDGTMVDTLPDIAYCVQLALVREGLQEVCASQVRDWIGNGVEALIRRALASQRTPAGTESLVASMLEQFNHFYAQHNGSKSAVYPGVLAGLEFLRERAIPVGCITNKPERFTLPLLESCGLLARLSLVVSGDTLEQKKPHPAPLLYACRHYGVGAEESLFIGDSSSDIRAARAAGMPIVCVDYGYNHGNAIHDARPDAVISSLAEMARMFQQDCDVEPKS